MRARFAQKMGAGCLCGASPALCAQVRESASERAPLQGALGAYQHREGVGPWTRRDEPWIAMRGNGSWGCGARCRASRGGP